MDNRQHYYYLRPVELADQDTIWQQMLKDDVVPEQHKRKYIHDGTIMDGLFDCYPPEDNVYYMYKRGNKSPPLWFRTKYSETKKNVRRRFQVMVSP